MRWQNINKNILRLTDLVEEVSEAIDAKSPKTVLNFALDVIKPYLQALGLRVSRISEENIEVILPAKFQSTSQDQQLDEGAICSAGIFAFKQLWKKNSPKGKFSISIQKIIFEKIRTHQFEHGDLSLRFELPKLTRETIFADLSDRENNQSQFLILVYNQSEHIVAEIHLVADLHLNKSLEWK